jgi:hypothetical protein
VTVQIVNPCFGVGEVVEAAVTPPPATASGAGHVALLSNAKPNADELLTGIATRLGEQLGVEWRLFAKPDPAHPAPPAMLQEVAAHSSLALVAIGD